jgi:hypothetical protein
MPGILCTGKPYEGAGASRPQLAAITMYAPIARMGLLHKAITSTAVHAPRKAAELTVSVAVGHW